MIKLATTVLLAIFIVAPFTAYGQTETWKSVMDSAIAETDTGLKKQMFDKALEVAVTPEQTFDTYLELSYMRSEQGIDGEAVYFAGEALKIADEKLETDFVRRSLAVGQKSIALRKVGRIDEAYALISEDVERKSQKGDHIWTPVPGGIKHRFSGMVCPDVVAQMPRLEFQNYSQAGIDVGCSYKLISGHYNYTTIYFSRYGKIDDARAIKDGGAALLTRLPDSKKIAVEQPAKFDLGTGNPVYYTQVSFGSVQDGERYTGAWTQVIGDWVLKTRVTWAAELGVNFGSEKTEALFSQNSGKIRAYLDVCKALDSPKSGKAISGNANSSAAIMSTLIIGLTAEISEQENDGAGDDHTPLFIVSSPEPEITCFAERSSGDEIVLGYHPQGTRRYTTYSAIIEDVFYVEHNEIAPLLNTSELPQFLLKSASEKGLSIYQIYSGEPDPSTVFEDIIAALNGKLNALGSVNIKDGQRQINIHTVPKEK